MEKIRRFASAIEKCPIRVVPYSKSEIREILDDFQPPDGTYKADPAEYAIGEIDTVISDENAFVMIFSLCEDLLTQARPDSADFFVIEALKRNPDPSVVHIVERSIFGMWLSVSEDVAPELIKKAKQYLRGTMLFTETEINDLL